MALTAIALSCVAQPVSADEPRAVSPSQRTTRARSVPLIVVGATTSGVGLLLMGSGVMTGLGETLCGGLSRIPSQDDPGEPAAVDDSTDECDNGAGAMLVTGLVLTLVGIPAIVIGAQRVPTKPPARAALVPLAVRQGAGLAIRIEL